MHAMMQKLDNHYKNMQECEEKTKYLAAGNLLSQDIAILSVGAHSQHFKEPLALLGTKTLIITDLDSQFLKTNSSKSKTFEACDPNDSKACRTGNTSLKAFFSTDKLEYFLNLPKEKKILSSQDNGHTWQADEQGHLRIAFQAYGAGAAANPRRTLKMSSSLKVIT